MHHSLVNLRVSVTGGRLARIELNRTESGSPRNAVEKRIEAQLLEYLSGERRSFDIPMTLEGTPMYLEVWREVERIPYGRTRTYGEIARAVGRPGAARAVGQANHLNPLPLVVPCHRVVASGGGLGGYGGGLDLKRKLLDMETSISFELSPQ